MFEYLYALVVSLMKSVKAFIVQPAEGEGHQEAAIASAPPTNHEYMSAMIASFAVKPSDGPEAFMHYIENMDEAEEARIDAEVEARLKDPNYQPEPFVRKLTDPAFEEESNAADIG